MIDHDRDSCREKREQEPPQQGGHLTPSAADHERDSGQEHRHCGDDVVGDRWTLVHGNVASDGGPTGSNAEDAEAENPEVAAPRTRCAVSCVPGDDVEMGSDRGQSDRRPEHQDRHPGMAGGGEREEEQHGGRCHGGGHRAGERQKNREVAGGAALGWRRNPGPNTGQDASSDPDSVDHGSGQVDAEWSERSSFGLRQGHQEADCQRWGDHERHRRRDEWAAPADRGDRQQQGDDGCRPAEGEARDE